MEKYFVNIVTHNGETDGWNYKDVKAFENLDSAKKEYHNALSTYIAYGKLDNVSVCLFDYNHNVIARENWHKEFVEVTE